MTTRKSAIRQEKVPIEFGQSAARIFAANEQINQLLIEYLDPAM